MESISHTEYPLANSSVNESSGLNQPQSFNPGLIVAGMMIMWSITGVIGNGFVLMFFGYTDRRDLTASRVFILAMAAVDVFGCGFMIPIQVYIMFISVAVPFTHEMVLNSLATWTVYTTAMLVEVMAWERYLAICRPLTFKSGVKKALKTCGVAAVISVVLTFLTMYPQETTTFKNGWISKFYGSQIFYCLVVCTVLVLYSLIGIKIKHHPGMDKKKVVPVTSDVQTTSSRYQRTETTDVVCTSSNLVDQSKTRNNEKAIGVNTVEKHVKEKTFPVTTTPERVSATPVDETVKSLAMQPKEDTTGPAVDKRKRKSHSQMVMTLFIVSLIFLLSWLPSWLYLLNLAPWHWQILIYVNNVANPFLYVIVNAKFRAGVKKMIKCSYRR